MLVTSYYLVTRFYVSKIPVQYYHTWLNNSLNIFYNAQCPVYLTSLKTEKDKIIFHMLCHIKIICNRKSYLLNPFIAFQNSFLIVVFMIFEICMEIKLDSIHKIDDRIPLKISFNTCFVFLFIYFPTYEKH